MVTPEPQNQIQFVNSFPDLQYTPFQGAINAICWKRILEGDFSEIVKKLPLIDNITVIDELQLLQLHLSAKGLLARDTLLNDLKMLKDCGASPALNLIQCYERDEHFPFFPTDVYSFHVDRSPVLTDTYLCTYYGTSSEILPNAQAEQKVIDPEIRKALLQQYGGAEGVGFETFLKENFFDLHYCAKPGASIITLGTGNLWKLAVDHPGSSVQACVHRAPMEREGEYRLLLIC